MARWLKGAATKPDDPSRIPGIRVAKGEPAAVSCPLTSTHKEEVTGTHTREALEFLVSFS